MPLSFKRKIGIDGVLAWAKEWRADVVMSPFEPDEDVSLFRKNGIVALAQDLSLVMINKSSNDAFFSSLLITLLIILVVNFSSSVSA